MEFEKSKKGMVNELSAIAFGLISLVILVGIGIIIMNNMGSSVAQCPVALGYSVYNQTYETCQSVNTSQPITNSSDPTNTAWKAFDYGETQLGSTGLLSWLPAVIALLIGVFFLAYFAGGKTKGQH